MSSWIKFPIITPVLVALMFGTAFCDNVNFKLDRYVIEIGAFYDGTNIHAKGTVPQGSDVVIRISGHPEDLALKKKGKVMGVLWMNVSDLTFHHAPSVYMLYTSPGAKQYMEDPGLPFTFAALKDRVEISPKGEDSDFLFKEFLKLKEEEHVYALNESAVQFVKDTDQGTEFKATLAIPPKMKKGDYEVDVYAVKDGNLLGSASTDLKIRYVGFPGLLDNLAFNHALVYGILATLIAIAAGLFIGAIFKDKGGAH